MRCLVLCFLVLAAVADYVNHGKGVKMVLNADVFGPDDFDDDVPELPKVQVGEYQYGNVGVTLEAAVRAVAESVGYTFTIRKDGVVLLVKNPRSGIK